MVALKIVGTPQARIESALKTTGTARYAADHVLPRTLWARALRSPFPHAIIESIDVSKAQKVPGVHAVLTAKDFNGILVGFSFQDMPILADGKVRFVGEKVAAVCAETKEIAEEAVGLIDVRYRELPATFDPIEAMKPGAPIVHENTNSYVGLAKPVPAHSNIIMSRSLSHGDIAVGFEQSDKIFENSFSTTWVHHGYLEPTTCTVEVRGEIAHVWTPNKAPGVLYKQLSEAVGIRRDQIVVHAVSVGGDFGGRRHLLDTPLCYVFSKVTGRPVKMAMDYSEELLAADPRHPGFIRMKTGVKHDGTLVALEAQVIFNGGAYGSFTPGGGLANVEGILGPYRIPNIKVETYTVYTNTLPGGYMRAPAGPQTVFAGESALDMVAHALGIDPLEMRRKNVLHRGDISASGHRFIDANANDYLERAVMESRYSEPKKPGVGRGIAISGWHVSSGQTYVEITVQKNGRVLVQSSKPDVGTGILTAAQIVAAEELGLPASAIDGGSYPYERAMDDRGSYGSTGNKSVGIATIKATKELKAKLVKAAADQLGWPESHSAVERGSVINLQTKESISLFDLARRSSEEITANAEFGPAESVDGAIYSVQVAEVEVERETGQVRLKRITSVHDAGRVMNPLIYEGQIDGGLIQGIGYSLMEGIKVEDGRPTTTTLGDYKLPTMADIPELTRVIVEDPGASDLYGPYGSKSIGESSINGVAAAIANAVEDAVGVRINELPISAEKIYSSLKASR